MINNSPHSTPTSIPGGVKRQRRNIARKSTGRKVPRIQYGEGFKSDEQGSSEGSSCFSNTSQDVSGTASLCSEFADWLDGLGESETDKRVLDAVERDGGQFFHLIQCTLDYERALSEGCGDYSDIDAETSGPTGHRTKVLRDFAEFLGVKEKGISNCLSLAIDRDGKQLFRLARCCLSFNNAINGEGSGSP